MTSYSSKKKQYQESKIPRLEPLEPGTFSCQNRYPTKLIARLKAIEQWYEHMTEQVAKDRKPFGSNLSTLVA